MIIAALSGAASATDSRFPWQFDMTPAEVQAQEKFGPYRSFSNGDLETCNAIFNGRTENIQFFFSDQKLRRIGIYLYEGPSINDAASRWLELFDILARDFGAVATPGNKDPRTDGETSRGAFISNAISIVSPGAKTQMAPLQQPSDAFVFASFWGSEYEGQHTYYVVAYFDRPPNRPLERGRDR